MSFGYCSPHHSISTIPTSYLNNYLRYAQTDWISKLYRLMQVFRAIFLFYDFWQYSSNMFLCATVTYVNSGKEKHGRNEVKNCKIKQ